MPSKAKKPGVAKRVSDRKAFVSEKKASKGITDKQANQRYYVQTRMAEMKAKGKTVTPEMRKQLQQKFQSGNVARKGFAAPAKKTSVASSLGSGVSKVTPKVQSRTDTEGRMGSKAAPKVRSATSNMQGIRGYGRVDSKGRTGFGATSSKSGSMAQKRSGFAAANPRTAELFGGVYGAVKAVGRAVNNSRNDPSRVSMSAAANRAAKAKADAAKKKKMNAK